MSKAKKSKAYVMAPAGVEFCAVVGSIHSAKYGTVKHFCGRPVYHVQGPHVSFDKNGKELARWEGGERDSA